MVGFHLFSFPPQIPLLPGLATLCKICPTLSTAGHPCPEWNSVLWLVVLTQLSHSKIPAALPVRGGGCRDHKEGRVNEGVITVKVCLHVSPVCSSLLFLLAHCWHHTCAHAHTQIDDCDLLSALPPLSQRSVFKRSRDQTKSENACVAFIWQPCILNPFKRGCRGKKGEKIGHVSHNLCSVNFPAHASTVYRVLRISNLRLLFSAPPLISQTTILLFTPPSLFVAYVILIFFSPVLFCVTSEDALPWGG